MKPHFFVGILIFMLLASCGDPYGAKQADGICPAAAQHVATCMGTPFPSQTSECNADIAQQLLVLDCDQIALGLEGKADLGFEFGCDVTGGLFWYCDMVGPPFSDDFNGREFRSFWQLSKPIDYSKCDGMVRETDGAVEFLLMNSASTCAALVQPMDDTDFEVEVKFNSLSLASDLGEIQEGLWAGGILEDGSRAEFRIGYLMSSFGTQLTTSGDIAVRSDTELSGFSGESAYLRVQRSGQQWTVWCSTNGQDWREARRFELRPSMKIEGLGIYGISPKFLVSVDYFLNRQDPKMVDAIVNHNQ